MVKQLLAQLGIDEVNPGAHDGLSSLDTSWGLADRSACHCIPAISSPLLARL